MSGIKGGSFHSVLISVLKIVCSYQKTKTKQRKTEKKKTLCSPSKDLLPLVSNPKILFFMLKKCFYTEQMRRILIKER